MRGPTRKPRTAEAEATEKRTMNMKRWFAMSVATTAALFPHFAGAQNLPDALAIAYASNPTLLAQRAGLRATDESVSSAEAARRPSLSMSASASGKTKEGLTSVSSTSSSLSLSLKQSLYRGGRIVNGIEQAELGVLSARAQLAGTEQQILSSVIDAYVNLLRDQAVLQLNQSSEQVLRSELEATRDRFQLGAATRTDIAQSESRVAAAAASRIQAEGQLQSSIATFRRIVGQAPAGLTTPEPLTGLPNSLEECISIALDENPSYVSAVLAQLSADKSLVNAEAARLPTVSMSASVSRSGTWSETFTNVPPYSSSVGVSVSVPLYQSGAEYSAIRKAQQSNLRAQIQVEESRRQIIAQVTQSWQSLASARAAIYSRSEQVRASEVALEGVHQEEEVGARTLLDVLNAQQDLLNARVALVSSRRNEIIASYALMSAMGRLTAQNLRLPVQLYDPSANFDAVRAAWFRRN
jgi:outer membrane protein